LSPSQEDSLVASLKKTSLLVGVATGLNVLISASFGIFWTNFLRYKVDDRIELRVGRKVDLAIRVIQSTHPTEFWMEMQKDPSIRALRGDQ